MNERKKILDSFRISIAGRINYSLIPALPKGLRRFILYAQELNSLLLDRPDYQFPKILGIESTNACNLQCNHCPSHRGITARKRGYMSKDLFRRLIQEVLEKSKTKQIELHKDGEPLLHPNIAEFIGDAKERELKVRLTTNGTLLTPEIAEKIFLSGIDVIEFSIGACYPETYSLLRRGNWTQLMQNLCDAIRIRAEVQIPLHTYFIFQIIRCPEISDNEINEFKKKWKAIKHSAIFVKDFVNWAGAFASHYPEGKRYPCGLLWIYPSINWNGKVSACCQDWREELIIGDVNKTDLEAIWNGKYLRELRKMHLDHCIPEGHPCYECTGWSFMPELLNLKI